MFILSGILTAMRDSFFSADDGCVSGAQCDGNSQAIGSFAEDSVLWQFTVFVVSSDRAYLDRNMD